LKPGEHPVFFVPAGALLARVVQQPLRDGLPDRITEPIELPKGKKLVTLRDAAPHITKLPKAEHDGRGIAGGNGSADAGCRR
jgi:hypothetical protein